MTVMGTSVKRKEGEEETQPQFIFSTQKGIQRNHHLIAGAFKITLLLIFTTIFTVNAMKLLVNLQKNKSQETCFVTVHCMKSC